MNDAERLAAGLRDAATVVRDAADRAAELATMVEAMRRCLANGGTLFFAGNGGSAADAQHLATEYVVRYRAGPQRPLRAIALTTDSSLVTAAANDFGFDQIFARQLEALARRGDVLVLHSTSGRSANCLVAADAARRLGVVCIALLGGDGGELVHRVDHAFVVQDQRSNHVQEAHLAIAHQIAAILTAEAGDGKPVAGDGASGHE